MKKNVKSYRNANINSDHFMLGTKLKQIISAYTNNNLKKITTRQ